MASKSICYELSLLDKHHHLMLLLWMISQRWLIIIYSLYQFPFFLKSNVTFLFLDSFQVIKSFDRFYNSFSSSWLQIHNWSHGFKAGNCMGEVPLPSQPALRSALPWHQWWRHASPIQSNAITTLQKGWRLMRKAPCCFFFCLVRTQHQDTNTVPETNSHLTSPYGSMRLPSSQNCKEHISVISEVFF